MQYEHSQIQRNYQELNNCVIDLPNYIYFFVPAYD